MTKRLPCDTRGQALIEFVASLFVLLVILAGLIFFGRVLYVRIGLDMASYDGVRAASAALDASAGITQGRVAALNTLVGFGLDASDAVVTVASVGAWERGAQVYCRVSYNLSVADVPFVAAFFSGVSVSLESRSWSRVETHRSEWP